MATRDDELQAATALKIISTAEWVIVPVPCILELVWVLGSLYRLPRSEIAEAVHVLINSANVLTEVPVVEAGLDVFAAGGDFADGIIASSGAAMGSETFVSFDRKAVTHVSKLGLAAQHANTFA